MKIPVILTQNLIRFYSMDNVNVQISAQAKIGLASQDWQEINNQLEIKISDLKKNIIIQEKYITDLEVLAKQISFQNKQITIEVLNNGDQVCNHILNRETLRNQRRQIKNQKLMLYSPTDIIAANTTLNLLHQQKQDLENLINQDLQNQYQLEEVHKQSKLKLRNLYTQINTLMKDNRNMREQVLEIESNRIKQLNNSI